MNKQGIKPSRVYLPYDAQYMGGLVLDFFASHFSHIDKLEWQQRLRSGLITNDCGETLSEYSLYQAGQTLLYYRTVKNEAVIPFEPTILHLDEHLLVVDKPHFLPVIPTGQFVSQTLLTKLRLHPDLQSPPIAFDLDDISPIHRLDKDTAGVMLLSVNPSTRAHYQALFAHRQVKKTYEAIAPLRTDLTYPYLVQSRLVRGEPFFLTQTVDGAVNAVTTIELLAQLEPSYCKTNDDHCRFGHYRLSPLTGKKHQLRVHMASLDMALLNDNLYPIVKPQGVSDFSKPLQLLAKSISFIDPLTNDSRTFFSQLSLR